MKFKDPLEGYKLGTGLTAIHITFLIVQMLLPDWHVHYLSENDFKKDAENKTLSSINIEELLYSEIFMLIWVSHLVLICLDIVQWYFSGEKLSTLSKLVQMI